MRTARVAGQVAAAVVLALGAAACTGHDDGGGVGWGYGTVHSPAVVVRPTPTGHGVTLSEPAPASAQWIVDATAEPGASPENCPVPSLADMIVLDDEAGHSRAAAVWLGDGGVECLVTISNRDGINQIVLATSLDSLADRPVPLWLGGWAIFTVFPGDAGRVVVKDDDDRVFGPPHQRLVDFGGGREFTVVEYAYLRTGPEPEDPAFSVRARVCPDSTGPCLPARWIAPSASPLPLRSTSEDRPRRHVGAAGVLVRNVHGGPCR